MRYCLDGRRLLDVSSSSVSNSILSIETIGRVRAPEWVSSSAPGETIEGK